MASVASELEFNQENASLNSLEISNNDIGISAAAGGGHNGNIFQDTHNRQTFGEKQPSGGLVKNLNQLLEKHVKMMDNMTMEDFGFQQRVLQRMIELTTQKENELKKK